MDYSPEISVKFNAISVALSGKSGSLTQQDVDDLVTRASQYLDSGNPIFRAVSEFATQYQICKSDKDQLFAICETMHRAVIAENNSAALVEDFSVNEGAGTDG